MSNKELLTVNTIRILSAEAVQKANSGHPGLPMGAAPMAYTLWARNMKFNSKNPKWAGRDRFILSAGHGSMLVYSLLHLFGYGLTIDDLKEFRQLGSKTPGHPEYGHTAGVEVTTGPLGQGFANGVGMAMAEAYMAEKFNRPGVKLVDNYTYVLAGDGCMMEGISSEAASLAGTLKLGKLVVMYDSNSITIEGSTNITFREDVAKRFDAYGWQVLHVKDGTDIDAIDAAIKEAKADLSKPALVIINTEIGYGCPAKQGKASAHGEPLGEDNVKAAKECLGWNYEPFTVPEEVRQHLKPIIEQGEKAEAAWNKMFEDYKKQFPELAEELSAWYNDEIPEDVLSDSSLWEYKEKAEATRASSGDILNYFAKKLPNMIGGSADLGPSNKTNMSGRGDFSAENYAGANLHFGVREHAMGAVANGMALYGGLRLYTATFFIFSDYMKPAIRMAALMGLPVIYVLTHDTIGVGEDGPTHEPIEQLISLRSIPNLTVIRPADRKETAAAWYAALTSKKTPTALILTRQNLPQYKETGKEALKGAYILVDSEKKKPDIILIGVGSELQLVYEAGKVLKSKGIDARVVSMPSWELFEAQTAEYKNSVLPGDVEARLSVEAGSSYGWHKYTGLKGDTLSIDTFGASGKAEVLFKEYGYTVENVVDKALKVVGKK